MSNDRAPCLKGHWLWGNLKDFNTDNLSFIESAARQGDLVQLRFGPMRGYFVNHPDYVCKVLAARSKSFRKPAVVQRALVDILGENIFTSNGAAWKQRRQALQPAFHLRHVERYTQIMLVFTWLALMQNPDVADRLYAEVEDVLGLIAPCAWRISNLSSIQSASPKRRCASTQAPGAFPARHWNQLTSAAQFFRAIAW